ncbi:hypothetical protein [Carboxylicivirga caseinilyticus]|uniref:hypothetical protein n=1 Tax=Carboxylicivirga caseinilyticus TaxID=3417572 RepID=UPI002AA7CA2C|nr:hypothetical protein [uncultured Carboxylicivirga sp.]MCU4165052.1 hypothetical protein [Marinilabiliaceae bacterium A049]
MLESCKTVLNGVHDDKFLFRKELIKSLSWLEADDQVKLQAWVRKNFYSEHADIIEEILNTKYNFAS